MAVHAAGQSYERSVLLRHLKTVGAFDPVTRERLTERDLVPNLNLRDAIADFVEENPWAVDADIQC